MNPHFVDLWMDWLRSRPCGYSKRALWEVKPGDRQGRDARSPLAWIVDRWLEKHPNRGEWVLPNPSAGRLSYTLVIDGQSHTYLPPREVLQWAGMDEGTISAVMQLATQASSHANFAERLRLADRSLIQPAPVTVPAASLFDL